MKNTAKNESCIIVFLAYFSVYHFYLASLDYSRVEVAVDARRRSMKLWSSTAIGPQQSRCSEIGSLEE
jgi:hypothetical protein